MSTPPGRVARCRPTAAGCTLAKRYLCILPHAIDGGEGSYAVAGVLVVGLRQYVVVRHVRWAEIAGGLRGVACYSGDILAAVYRFTVGSRRPGIDLRLRY